MTRSGALLALAGLALLLAASCGSEPTEEPRPDSTAFEAALARRDSLRAVRAALRAEADSVEAESEALGAELEARPDFRDIESRIDAAIETLNLDGDAPPAAQIEALLPMLRSEIPDYADRFEALLFRIAEIDGEFDKLRESDVSASSRYALFTGCAPVKLSRFGETGGVGTASSARVREMAESRLRAARIWGGQEPDNGEVSPLVLYIGYEANQATFSKEVWEPLSGEFHVSDVWTSEEEAEADILQRASILIDRFILEYMRVNEGYCP